MAGRATRVGLHVRKTAAPERPVFEHPQFDYESRIVTAILPQLTVASVYVPNGGKDFDAKVGFIELLASTDADDFRRRETAVGPMRRHERGTDRDGRPPEGAEAQRNRTAARRSARFWIA